MFTQFRAQYPQGSIETEMLPKSDGQFVFRAVLSQNKLILSTATARDLDLETAEDKAVRRALHFAGFPLSTPSSNNWSPPMEPEPKGSPTPPLLHPAVSPPIEPPTLVRSSPVVTPVGTERSSGQGPELNLYRSELPLLESLPTISPPEDLSDEITQTKVELERLGWTTEQGKEYLMRTFGKKSRQQLTPTELRQFLHHLKSQPTRL